jgi:hypothetical protein
MVDFQIANFLEVRVIAPIFVLAEIDDPIKSIVLNR